MTEREAVRLSDADLDAIEERAKAPAGSLWKGTVIDLVAEVRRLRALIGSVLARRAEDGNTYVCPCCDQVVEAHANGCPWPEFKREAGA